MLDPEAHNLHARDTRLIYLNAIQHVRGRDPSQLVWTSLIPMSVLSRGKGARDTRPIYLTPYKTYVGVIQVNL